ncbi:MAG: carbohydrate kinase family protein [Candidatus Moranbacteria bacterium]|nr:carbohydrate kinase family protein [Candidatus Moranbacteria bacterium]
MNTDPQQNTSVLCIGSIGKDVFFPTNQGTIMETPDDMLSQKKIAFELGAKIYVEDRVECVGGCAANVATGIALLGTKTIINSIIGSDQTGEWLKEELEEKGVSIQNLQRANEKKSDLSMIVVDQRSGQRTIFVSRDVGEKLRVQENMLPKTSHAYIASLHGEWESNIQQILLYKERTGTKIIYNPGQHNIHQNVKKVLEMIAQTDMLFINKDEALEILSQQNDQEELKKQNDPQFLTNQLRILGTKMVIMTDGQNGAWAHDGQTFYTACCLSHTAIDATGAGDSFLSGFVGAILKEKTPDQALQWGTANATSVVQKYGATPGLITIDRIEEEASKVEIKKESIKI